MNRKLCRNKKGVSTVIATIIMIMVVMVGMSVLFGALIVYSDNFHSGIGSSVLESITVEDVYFRSSTPNYVELTLFNTGKVELKVTNVYIDGQMATIPAPLTIAQGAHELLKVTPTGSTFSIGSDYSFKIVTARGTGFEGTYIW
jgi:hypothetical protein